MCPHWERPYVEDHSVLYFLSHSQPVAHCSVTEGDERVVFQHVVDYADMLQSFCFDDEVSHFPLVSRSRNFFLCIPNITAIYSHIKVEDGASKSGAIRRKRTWAQSPKSHRLLIRISDGAKNVHQRLVIHMY